MFKPSKDFIRILHDHKLLQNRQPQSLMNQHHHINFSYRDRACTTRLYAFSTIRNFFNVSLTWKEVGVVVFFTTFVSPLIHPFVSYLLRPVIVSNDTTKRYIKSCESRFLWMCALVIFVVRFREWKRNWHRVDIVSGKNGVLLTRSELSFDGIVENEVFCES